MSETLTVLFASNNKPASLAIKLFTLSKWSHCAILDGDFVIDATLATGVRRIPFKKWKAHYKSYEAKELPCDSRKEAILKARRQVGKKYDWLGIFSFVFHKDYEDKKKWFCSELVAYAMNIFEMNKLFLISPQFLSIFKGR